MNGIDRWWTVSPGRGRAPLVWVSPAHCSRRCSYASTATRVECAGAGHTRAQFNSVRFPTVLFGKYVRLVSTTSKGSTSTLAAAKRTTADDGVVNARKKFGFGSICQQSRDNSSPISGHMWKAALNPISSRVAACWWEVGMWCHRWPFRLWLMMLHY
jgi:hypothetical protein